MTLLRELNRLGILRTIDDALAQSLRRLDPDTPDEVLAAAALASLAVSQGHAGFDPARPRQLTDADLPWPEADVWTQALQASPWVATPDAPDEESAAAPLAFEYGLLYLRRYREYGRRLAQQLRRMVREHLVLYDSLRELGERGRGADLCQRVETETAQHRGPIRAVSQRLDGDSVLRA